MEPQVTPDGKKLHFKSTRPLPRASHSGFHQWYSEKGDSGWSEPVPMEYPFNDKYIEHPTLSDNGNTYFAMWNDIYVSRIINGAYHEPTMIGNFINNMPNCSHPFIAPDESYIIFNKMVNHDGEVDGYYISFKGQDDKWLPPQKVFKLENRESVFVTRDGEYIICKDLWASAEILEEFRPKQ